MAFSGGNKKGPISEINVTPLVDVMLVLLVIFMITAPLMLNGIKLELPKTKETHRVNLTTNQVVLSFTSSKEYFLGKQKILFAEVIDLVKKEFEITKTKVLFLRADYKLSYGDVARLMGHLKKAGITEIALITETEK